MISHATLLASDGLDLIIEQQKQQSTAYGIDSIEPKCHELEDMKKKLAEQIDEKRSNLKFLRNYVDKLESVCISHRAIICLAVFCLHSYMFRYHDLRAYFFR